MLNLVGFQDVTLVSMKSTIFWDVMLVGFTSLHVLHARNDAFHFIFLLLGVGRD
jgi:hypothetical protein